MKTSHLLKALAFATAVTISISAFSQEEGEIICKGEITDISSDSVITMNAGEGYYPEVGQKVSVFKHFKVFGGDGTMGIADAKVKSVTDAEVKVQVVLYTSTMVQDGKRVPMVQVGQVGELRWEADGGKRIVSFESMYNEAKALYSDNQFAKAAVAFTDLMDNFEVDWTVYHYRGECYFRLREDEKCLVDLDKAIEMQAQDYQARLYRAFVYKRNREYAKGVEDLNVLLNEADPKDADKIFMLQQRAVMKVELDQFKSAEADMKKVEEMDPGNLFAYDFLNKYGGEDGPFEYPDEYAFSMTAEVISQGSNNYSLVLKPLKGELSCMFDADETTYSSKIDPSTIGVAYSWGENFRMTDFVFEVTSSSKNELQLKILFWSNTMNDEPSMTEFKAGDQITFGWN